MCAFDVHKGEPLTENIGHMPRVGCCPCSQCSRALAIIDADVAQVA